MPTLAPPRPEVTVNCQQPHSQPIRAVARIVLIATIGEEHAHSHALCQVHLDEYLRTVGEGAGGLALAFTVQRLEQA